MKAPSALRTIGEVSKIIDVPVYVIRFWEKKFTSIKPIKKKGGNRLYDQNQLVVLKIIKSLLYEKKYSIEGAKKILNDEVGMENEKMNILKEIKLIVKELRSLI